MRSKLLLVIGIILLSFGILIKTVFHVEFLGLALIIIGVVCKIIYIFLKVKNNEYKPGRELLFLVLGLLLFLTGMYCTKSALVIFNPLLLIITGIILKSLFVIRFIQIIRDGRNN